MGDKRRIYLAASWSQRKVMQGYRDRLIEAGHQVTSRWIDYEGPGTMKDGVVSDGDKSLEHAADDVEDITAANLVAVFTDVPSSTGGLHFETGYALASGKSIVLVGPQVSIFFTLIWLGCDDFEGLLEVLS